MLTLIQKGGIFIWPLMVCSILVIAIIFEKIYVLIKNRDRYSSLEEKILDLISNGKFEDCIQFLNKTKSPIAHISYIYLTHFSMPKSELEELLKSEGKLLLSRLEGHLKALSTIAHISPLLGLLGTVTGMIQAFQKLESLGSGVNIEVLAGGIWEALLTTAVGLTIAIPAMVAYNFFNAKIDSIESRMEYIVVKMRECFNNKNKISKKR